ncbi:hypothetical protein OG458_42680 (plasmid) [Streptomyces sp. NBC_01281]|uniref:hypothetical protein n=1 Tax=Streptomyces sp. NBC_01281 TaxID=2903811 RepID=UPI002E112425|nr:hypothetical protein OG458_42680 [Streptomyces sp. NBC_01281]
MTPMYEIATREADDGTLEPAEHLWTPCADGTEGHGFIDYRGMHVTGLDSISGEDALYPAGFIVLGHQTWADTIEAAAAYMARVHGWRSLHLYPGDDPAVLIPRVPRAVHAHGAFLYHPHPDHPCSCEWDDTWRMAWAPDYEADVVPITAMRHPAAALKAVNVPNPDHDLFANWAP